MAKQTRHIGPTRAEDFPAWYQSVVAAGELAEMAHVRGCMVIKPWGLGIWEEIRNRLDAMFKARGVENVYFPLFIPLSYIEKEATHVAGFAKEMAVVTHHRLEERDGRLVPAAPLAEPVIVRPTSETIFGQSMAKWIESYRDLPMLLNQWANVVRWEMRPRVLLRTTEFLWQEGHTAHETEAEALAESLEIHELYRKLAVEWLAIPVIPGEKPPSERFPGAERSFTIEAMMQDGKAVQAGTSHFLGQNFAVAADIEFDGRDGKPAHVWTTSWGMSTRMVGALVMVHGDDDGLRVPPYVAPRHVVLLPIQRGNDDDARVLDECRRIAAELNRLQFGPSIPLSCRIDARDIRSGDRKWEWIRKGVPLLIEVGPRDLNEGAVKVLRRDDLAAGRSVPIAELAATLPHLLEDVQAGLLQEATDRLDASLAYDIADVTALEKHFMATDPPFVVAPWCGSTACEQRVGTWSVSIRCLPFERACDPGPCVVCGTPGDPAVFGRSY